MAGGPVDWFFSVLSALTLVTCPAVFESRDELTSAVADWLKKSNVADRSTRKYGPIRDWDVSLVSDMSNMFRFANSFNGNLSKWDVSKVTDIAGMFRGAESFNNDISQWDVSQVVDMGRMFDSAVSFNGDISKWDVSKVIYMKETFYVAKSFNTDISKWDVSNVNYMTWMFYGAESFNGDISNWDVSVVTDMSYMFYNAVSFNGDISKWDLSTVTDMSRMFYGAKSFSHTLCSEPWVTSAAAKALMFEGSPGSISTGICGLYSTVIILILFPNFFIPKFSHPVPHATVYLVYPHPPRFIHTSAMSANLL